MKYFTIKSNFGFWREGKPEFPEKTSWCRVGNQQTQPTFDAGFGSRSRALAPPVCLICHACGEVMASRLFILTSQSHVHDRLKQRWQLSTEVTSVEWHDWSSKTMLRVRMLERYLQKRHLKFWQQPERSFSFSCAKPLFTYFTFICISSPQRKFVKTTLPLYFLYDYLCNQCAKNDEESKS